MAKALCGAFGCDLVAMQKTLNTLELDDFGEYKRESKEESAKAVFRAALQAYPQVECSVLNMSTELQFATRKHLMALLATIPSLAESSVNGTLGDWTSGDGSVTPKHNRLAKALEKLANGLTDRLSFMDLKVAMRQVPRVAAQRIAFVESLQLTATLARHLPPGTLDDGLAGL